MNNSTFPGRCEGKIEPTCIGPIALNSPRHAQLVDVDDVDVELVEDDEDVELVEANCEGDVMICGGVVVYVTAAIWPEIVCPNASWVVTWKVLEPLPRGTQML